MDLSVIIVNFRSSGHVLNCLSSMRTGTKNIQYEIIVVDNASGDQSEQIILSSYPEVIWLQSKYNAGFARANNMGIRKAKGRMILLLNADTLILNDAIEKTFLFFEKETTYAACGVQLINTDGSPQHSGARFVYGALNNLRPLPYAGKALRNIAFSSGIKQPNIFDVKKNEEVDWIVGAFLMTRKTVIDKAGLLDEDFFMYAEEIEWCARLRKIGPLILFHEPKVVHLGGGSSMDFYRMGQYDNSWDLWSKKGAQIMLSQFLRIRKQWGWRWFLIHFILYLTEIPFFAICLSVNMLINKKKTHYTWKQWHGFVKNMFTLIPYSPSILINQHRFYKIN